MEHKVIVSESSSDSQSTGSRTQLDPSLSKKKKRQWRIRTFLLIGISLALAVGGALLFPLCIYNSCFSDDPDDALPPTTTTTTTTTTPTPPDGARGLTVMTQYGPVTGREIDLEGNGLLADTVYTYHSIPYAKPPVGSLRFQKPETPDSWSEPRMTTELPPMCIQPPAAIWATHQGWDNFQEDCLYINIFTPKDTADDPYPVMVYLHGGGFDVSGSIQYPGHYYAKRGVVMVSFNYRLGVFGFATTDTPASHSNYGMWDMLKAQQFVKDNIRQFGGDPDKITIFGESAGGVAVGLFVLSPHTEGMFQQAIYTSGTEMGSWAVSDPTLGQDLLFVRVAETVGCGRDDNEEMMECMRELDADTIFDNAYVSCPGCITYMPMVDGLEGFVPHMPLRMRDLGYAHPVPVIGGTNMDESGIFSVLGMDFTFLWRDMNRTEFEDGINTHVQRNTGRMTVEGAEERIYESALLTYSPWPLLDHSDKNKINLGHVQSDMSFLVPTNHMLHYHNRIAPCYQYVFDVKVTLLFNPLPSWIGVPHAFELPYVFAWPQIQVAPPAVQNDTGYLRLPAPVIFVEEDILWSDYTIHLWTNFAKYGDPTPDEHPLTPPHHTGPVKWMPYTSESPWWFHIDNEITESNPEPTENHLNYRPLETAFQLNYAVHLGTGVDLHHDLFRFNGTGTPHSADSLNIAHSAEYYKLLLTELSWDAPEQ